MKTGPDKVFKPSPGKIFVFGSNLAGVHGAGAAKFAFLNCGARWGQGEGYQGSCYGIPTKDKVLETLPLDIIKESVEIFLEFAWEYSELQFFVTKIGCGLAGYLEEQIAPMFQEAPTNCELPHGWRGEQLEGGII